MHKDSNYWAKLLSYLFYMEMCFYKMLFSPVVKSYYIGRAYHPDIIYGVLCTTDNYR